jgi:virulence-associated protein VapD
MTSESSLGRSTAALLKGGVNRRNRYVVSQVRKPSWFHLKGWPLEQVLSGTSDANVGFEDLRNLLIKLGFRERTRGSHHIFRRTGIEEMINLQREGAKAKQYQE